MNTDIAGITTQMGYNGNHTVIKIYGEPKWSTHFWPKARREVFKDSSFLKYIGKCFMKETDSKPNEEV